MVRTPSRTAAANSASVLGNRLSRANLKLRCEDGATRFEVVELERALRFDFVNLVTDGDRVFVTYEGRNTDGHRFRNTEILTVRNQRIVDVEVYFGWSVPHKAAQGEFLNDAMPR